MKPKRGLYSAAYHYKMKLVSGFQNIYTSPSPADGLKTYSCGAARSPGHVLFVVGIPPPPPGG
jgi:hypothetical protein